MEILHIIYFIVGFAVFSYARDTVYMDKWCNETYYIGSDPDIRIKLTNKFYYDADLDCTFTFYGQYGPYLTADRLMVNFQDLSICCEDFGMCNSAWLRIHDGWNTSDPTIGKDEFCGLSTPDLVYTTSGPEVTFHFQSDGSRQDIGFDIILTHFRTGWCASKETRCTNGRCIDNSLVCNGYNPCGDYSDCDRYGDYEGSSDTVIVGVVIAASVGGALGFIVLVTTIVICCVVCRRGRTKPRHQGHVIMTTIPTTTVGSPQQQVYGQLLPQYQVQISTSPVTLSTSPLTSYSPQNASSLPSQTLTTSPNSQN